MTKYRAGLASRSRVSRSIFEISWVKRPEPPAWAGGSIRGGHWIPGTWGPGLVGRLGRSNAWDTWDGAL